MAYLIYSVEDDDNIANIIKLTLQKQDYDVLVFSNGKSFFEAFENKKPDLVLLDMMLPDISGSEIIKKIRNNTINDDVRIIVISAKSMIVDKVEGLDLGADDYISKPFDLLELISRVNVQKRRQEKSNVYLLGELEIDIKKRKVMRNGVAISLTKKEFDILSLLLLKHDEVVTREELIKKIWGNEFEYETRTIDMHVKEIRKKLGAEGKRIETIYGIGFMVCLWEKDWLYQT